MALTISSLPLPIILGLFALAAFAVWRAGARLTFIADELSDRHRLSKSLTGLLLLSTATSLPEIATTLSAATRLNQALALNNLYGGVALQTTILAVADYWARGPITNYPRRMNHALEAALLMFLLTLTTVVVVLGEPLAIANVGLGSIVIAAGYAAAVRFLRVHDPEGDWLPVELPDDPFHDRAGLPREVSATSDTGLYAQAALSCVAIFVFGLALVMLAEIIADRTGLAAGFVGATLLAGATSLPELTTSITAVRMGAYSLAISNIFGSNLIMLVLVFPADVLFRGKPLLADAGPMPVLALLFGILVTCIYLVGLIARRKPRLGKFGIDSVAVLITFLASLAGYYFVS